MAKKGKEKDRGKDKEKTKRKKGKKGSEKDLNPFEIFTCPDPETFSRQAAQHPDSEIR